MYEEERELWCIEELLATLEGAVVGSMVVGVTRSIERDENDVACGLVRGGRGLADKGYRIDLLKDEGGV